MTIGDEGAEEKQKKELRKKRESKKFEKKEEASLKEASTAAITAGEKFSKKTTSQETNNQQISNEANEEEKLSEASPKAGEAKSADGGKKQKKEKFLKKRASPRSSKYTAVAGLVDKKKIYSLKEALEILPKLKTAKFDETVELHINTTEPGIQGGFTLPHGTGKKTRVVIVSATKDPKALDDLIQQVEAGKIDFDILIATPDSMPRLAKVARFLGPKGLMPNPKNGTVTTKPEDVAKKFEAGQINFKTEAKSPIIHMTVGKMSFSGEQLSQNITTALSAIQSGKMRSVTLKSTMSPGIRVDFSAALA